MEGFQAGEELAHLPHISPLVHAGAGEIQLHTALKPLIGWSDDRGISVDMGHPGVGQHYALELVDIAEGILS